MAVESRLFAGLAVFFFVEALGYGFGTRWYEPAGFIALLLSGLFCTAISFYLKWTGTKIGTRPEDRQDGGDLTVEGHYGDFSPGSMWPILVALAASIGALGIAIGWWLFLVDIPFAALVVVGWSMEAFRG